MTKESIDQEWNACRGHEVGDQVTFSREGVKLEPDGEPGSCHVPLARALERRVGSLSRLQFRSLLHPASILWSRSTRVDTTRTASILAMGLSELSRTRSKYRADLT